MPDISMCMNSKCPLKDTCYRFKAEPDPYVQSYGLFKFYVVEGATKCDYFWYDEYE